MVGGQPFAKLIPANNVVMKDAIGLPLKHGPRAYLLVAYVRASVAT